MMSSELSLKPWTRWQIDVFVHDQHTSSRDMIEEYVIAVGIKLQWTILH